MNIFVTIKPGISPMDRGYVEDLLISALDRQLGVEAECTGGGTLMSKSGEPLESDMDLTCPDGDAKGAIAVCRDALTAIPFTMTTVMTLRADEMPVVTFEVTGDDTDSDGS